jgi:preprotein translocase subunit SecA
VSAVVRVRRAPKQTGEVPTAAGRPSGDAATLAWCLEIVRQVNGLESAAQACTDDELRARTGQYRERLARGEEVRRLLPDAFATVREAARRAIGLRHHDVQLMGGAVLHLGMIAEMRTGEGKTLTATLPAYLGALSGQPVHVMTANDYLTGRDRDWMRPVYQFLGLSAGLLDTSSPNPDRTARRAEYAADVVYGQWDQFGYDYIRDNLVWEAGQQVQRGLGLAIVDEADLILIDQMSSSALLSAPASKPVEGHKAAAQMVRALRSGTHYTADRATMTTSLTDGGIAAVEDWFGIESLYDAAHGGLAHLIENAVKARALYERDRDYLVSGDQIVLIDRVSGRPLTARLAEGIHEALEAKEGLPVRPAMQIIGSVLCRDYLRQHDRLAGMTGAAASEAPVYRELYGLEVITIPANRPMIRVDHPDMLYRTRQTKLAAIAADTAKRAASGQPVLVGAMSEADAEAVARLLGDAGVSCELLSARNFEHEAAVLAEAGRPGAVTIVVKMAGRGVDIVLGGSSGAEREAVADRGGLCVLGTERNSDRRTELHLRGRAGRQGDPGESLFYLSAEDEVICQLLRAPKSLWSDGAPLGPLSRGLDKHQLRLGVQRAQWYKSNAAFHDVLAQQQRVIYAERSSLVRQQDAHAHVAAILDDVLAAEVNSALRTGSDPESLVAKLRPLYPVAGASYIQVAMRDGGRDRVAGVLAAVRRDAQQAYENREAQVGQQIMRQLERRALLSATDSAWRDHLAAMSDLESSLVIRAAGGTVSLPDYQREAAALYGAMTDQIRRTAITDIFFAKIALQHARS